MERPNGVLVVTGMLCLASTGPGALSFDGPSEAHFVPRMLWDLDFMSIHEMVAAPELAKRGCSPESACALCTTCKPARCWYSNHSTKSAPHAGGS